MARSEGSRLITCTAWTGRANARSDRSAPDSIRSSTSEVAPTFRNVEVSARLASPMMTCRRRYLSASACGSSRVLMMPRLSVVSRPTSTSM
ncbi:Uncharacterised protein [Mycobacteroides abscessus subsp. abscessus]|nr:Uncharacterised protein [Mycobacteroides abscessus subsp. abscessus]